MGDAFPSSPPPTSSDDPAGFPREWTLFARDFEATFGYTLQLGASRDEPLFAVRVHSNFSLFGRPALVLHAGPTRDGPRVALVRDATLNPTRARDFDLVIPPAGPGAGSEGRLDEDHEDRNLRVEVRAAMLELFPVHRFSVAVGRGPGPGLGPGGKEAGHFEWRHVFGEEVGDLIGGPAAGWKLARTDDAGEETLAVWVEGRKSEKEAMKFRFLNSGASGELGESFAHAAVVSALGMWDHVRRERQKNPDHGGH